MGTRVDLPKLLVALALPQLAGIVGSFFTMGAISGWYATLARPEIAPPNWVFGPVWTVLYLLMGIAAYLVWKRGLGDRTVRIALTLFGIQLALNSAWSIIFFGLENIGAALAEICVLWLAIVATMVAFARVSKAALVLLVPYLLWVSFAAYLNYQFWTLNG